MTARDGGQTSAAATPLFRILLSADEDTVQVHSAVRVKIATTNTSDQELLFWRESGIDQAGSAFSVMIQDANNNPPTDTLLGRTLKYNSSPNKGRGTWLMSSGGYVTLEPGKTSIIVSDLSQLFDFDKPGIYTVRVREAEAQHGVTADSNEIALKVIPAPDTQSVSSVDSVQASQPPFTLTIAPLAVKFGGGAVQGFSGMGMEVVTKNISNQKITLWVEEVNQPQEGSAYRVIVHDSDGNTPIETEFGHQAKNRTDVPSETNPEAFSGSSGEKLVLKPDESWTDTIDLKRLYHFYKSGEYTIHLERFDPATGTMVKSNTVTITITP